MRAARFAWVGLGGFVVQIAALQSLARAGVPYLPATALAVEAAILHNFLWHERWTWADRPDPGSRLARLLRFNGATAVTSIAGNVALVAGFAAYSSVPPLAANLLSVLALSLVNFLAADRLVFVTDLTHRWHDPTSM